jgi:hypothetical protein
VSVTSKMSATVEPKGGGRMSVGMGGLDLAVCVGMDVWDDGKVVGFSSRREEEAFGESEAAR